MNTHVKNHNKSTINSSHFDVKEIVSGKKNPIRFSEILNVINQ